MFFQGNSNDPNDPNNDNDQDGNNSFNNNSSSKSLSNEQVRQIADAVKQGVREAQMGQQSSTPITSRATSDKSDENIFTSGKSRGATGEQTPKITSIYPDFKEMADIGGKLFDSNIPTLDKMSEYINEIQVGTQGITQQFGKGREFSSEIATSIGEARFSIMEMGGTANAAFELMAKVGEETGRNFLQSSEYLEEIFATQEVVGLQAGTLVDKFTKAGAPLGKISDTMMNTMKYASSLGLNVKEVSEKLVTNLEKANLYNFSNGTQGLAKMAATATMFKVEMATVFSIAEKLLSPENAIEMASALQRLGAASTSLIDPLRLMDMAQNDPDQLMEEMVELSKQYTYFNEQTGKVEILPGAQRHIREIAGALGMSSDEFARMSIQAGAVEDKLSKIRMPNIVTNEEDKKLIANLAEMDPETGEYKIKYFDENFQEKQISIDELNNNIGLLDEIKKSQEMKEMDPKELALRQLSAQEETNNLLASIAGKAPREFAAGKTSYESGELLTTGIQAFTKSTYDALEKGLAKAIGDPDDESIKDLNETLYSKVKNFIDEIDPNKLEEENPQLVLLETFNKIKEIFNFENIQTKLDEINPFKKMGEQGEEGGGDPITPILDFIDKMTEETTGIGQTFKTTLTTELEGTDSLIVEKIVDLYKSVDGKAKEAQQKSDQNTQNGQNDQQNLTNQNINQDTGDVIDPDDPGSSISNSDSAEVNINTPPIPVEDALANVTVNLTPLQRDTARILPENEESNILIGSDLSGENQKQMMNQFNDQNKIGQEMIDQRLEELSRMSREPLGDMTNLIDYLVKNKTEDDQEIIPQQKVNDDYQNRRIQSEEIKPTQQNYDYQENTQPQFEMFSKIMEDLQIKLGIGIDELIEMTKENNSIMNRQNENEEKNRNLSEIQSETLTKFLESLPSKLGIGIEDLIKMTSENNSLLRIQIEDGNKVQEQVNIQTNQIKQDIIEKNIDQSPIIDQSPNEDTTRTIIPQNENQETPVEMEKQKITNNLVDPSLVIEQLASMAREKQQVGPIINNTQDMNTMGTNLNNPIQTPNQTPILPFNEGFFSTSLTSMLFNNPQINPQNNFQTPQQIENENQIVVAETTGAEQIQQPTIIDQPVNQLPLETIPQTMNTTSTVNGKIEVKVDVSAPPGVDSTKVNEAVNKMVLDPTFMKGFQHELNNVSNGYGTLEQGSNPYRK